MIPINDNIKYSSIYYLSRMASAAVDPEIDAILRIIKKQESVSVYALSKMLQWSYGKTERKVADLIKEGTVFASTRVDGGRNLKMLSLKPVSMDRENDIKHEKSTNHDILKEAFQHLHGIFLELNELGIDPTPALFSYAEKVGIDRERLMAMFDTAEQAIES